MEQTNVTRNLRVTRDFYYLKSENFFEDLFVRISMIFASSVLFLENMLESAYITGL